MAKNIIVAKMVHAQLVIAGLIGLPRKVGIMSGEQIENTSEITQKPDLGMLSNTANGQGTTPQPNSSNSTLPIKPSNAPWLMPRTVQQLAAQVNTVATKVLNGEIDMAQARIYGLLTRVVAQLIAAEVQRARLAKQKPDLSLQAPVEGESQ